MVIGIQFSVLVCGLVCGFDFDGSMQSQCASSTPEPRALVSVAGSAKLRSLNCQIVAMVQFSGQVVDTQGCSKKIGAKKCNLVQKRCNFPFRIADAYSGANRTRNPIDVGQCSDSSRTAFRFLSDSVPIQFGQCSGLRPDSFWATLEWCPKRSERCPREPGRVSERGRNRGPGVVERRWVNCQGSRSIRCESGKAPNGTKQIIHASNSRDPTA